MSRNVRLNKSSLTASQLRHHRFTPSPCRFDFTLQTCWHVCKTAAHTFLNYRCALIENPFVLLNSPPPSSSMAHASLHLPSCRPAADVTSLSLAPLCTPTVPPTPQHLCLPRIPSFCLPLHTAILIRQSRSARLTELQREGDEEEEVKGWRRGGGTFGAAK